MKDALGHGSNGNGGGGLNGALRARLNHVTILKPVTSNAAAANSLMSTLKSTQAPTHDAMAGRAADPTTSPGIDFAHNPLGLARSEVNEDGIPNINSRPSGFRGGQNTVNTMRGGGKDWSGSPIAMKGLHK